MKPFTRSGLLGVAWLACCPFAGADPITFTYTNINVPGGTGTSLNSINNTGQIVGSYTDSTGEHGFLDTNGLFTNIDVPGGSNTIPYKINNLGQIVGTYRDSSNGFRLFLDTHGVFTTINVPNGLADLGFTKVGLNDLGQIVGSTFFPSNGFSAFLYSNGQFSFIPAGGGVPANVSMAYDINNAGQIALAQSGNGLSFPFVYLNGTYTPIPGGLGGTPTGINNAGHVVGNYQNPSDAGNYFYAEGTTILFSRDPALLPHFYPINGLNDADQLVGVGPGGGVLATPVPEPASLLLLAAGLAGLGLWRHKWQKQRADEGRGRK